mgnify:CR=1 FL=1
MALVLWPAVVRAGVHLRPLFAWRHAAVRTMFRLSGWTVGYVIGGWNLATALPGAVGYLYVPALVCIAAASVSTAPLGARAAHSLDVRQLRRVFAVMLYALAAYMIYKGLSG